MHRCCSRRAPLPCCQAPSAGAGSPSAPRRARPTHTHALSHATRRTHGPREAVRTSSAPAFPLVFGGFVGAADEHTNEKQSSSFSVVGLPGALKLGGLTPVSTPCRQGLGPALVYALSTCGAPFRPHSANGRCLPAEALPSTQAGERCGSRALPQPAISASLPFSDPRRFASYRCRCWYFAVVSRKRWPPRSMHVIRRSCYVPTSLATSSSGSPTGYAREWFRSSTLLWTAKISRTFGARRHGW